MANIEQFLEIQKEIQPYKRILAQAADVILDEQVSKYPIFILHQQEVDMGILLIEKSKKLKWTVHASTLEEFVTKNLIHMDKAPDFIKTYKDPEHFLCIFLLSELGAQFLFIPK